MAGSKDSVRERTLNPETHTAPDYKRLIYEADAALHFYLKDDKEWWVAHGPENEPPGRLNGPWLFWTTYPSGGWELDFFSKEIASHHLEELYYIDYDGNEAHSIHRARLVPMDDAPEFVQEVVGGNSRDVDTGSSHEPIPDGGMVEPRYPTIAGRLEQTRDRLQRTQRMLREHSVNEDLYESVTDALAATDNALAIAMGTDDALTSKYEEQQ